MIEVIKKINKEIISQSLKNPRVNKLDIIHRTLDNYWEKLTFVDIREIRTKFGDIKARGIDLDFILSTKIDKMNKITQLYTKAALKIDFSASEITEKIFSVSQWPTTSKEDIEIIVNALRMAIDILESQKKYLNISKDNFQEFLEFTKKILLIEKVTENRFYENLLKFVRFKNQELLYQFLKLNKNYIKKFFFTLFNYSQFLIGHKKLLWTRTSRCKPAFKDFLLEHATVVLDAINVTFYERTNFESDRYKFEYTEYIQSILEVYKNKKFKSEVFKATILKMLYVNVLNESFDCNELIQSKEHRDPEAIKAVLNTAYDLKEKLINIGKLFQRYGAEIHNKKILYLYFINDQKGFVEYITENLYLLNHIFIAYRTWALKIDYDEPIFNLDEIMKICNLIEQHEKFSNKSLFEITSQLLLQPITQRIKNYLKGVSHDGIISGEEISYNL